MCSEKASSFKRAGIHVGGLVVGGDVGGGGGVVGAMMDSQETATPNVTQTSPLLAIHVH